ncbi:MAG: glycoside hydrolase family 97 catalytic domain-containing protein [Flavobacteriaceae bacterium]|nr:glycoside hydrolase family 97 catalytic domain-containing protein [Flavobacteriaceae bacterium]
MKNKFLSITFSFFLSMIILSCGNNQEKSWQIESPNKDIKIIVQKGTKSDDTSGLYYSILLKDNNSYKVFIENSQLGIERVDSKFVRDLEFVKSDELKNQKIEYSMISGSRKLYKNTYNEIKLKFKNIDHKNVDIIFRAFDNGIAFRYKFEKDSLKTVQITKELSSFNFGEGNFWAHPYDTITKYSPGYETYYKSSLKIGTNAPKNKNGWAFPMLFETQNHWALVSESGMDGSYGASHIHGDCTDGIYRIKFAETKEARGFYDNISTMELPGKTPWRFITIGNKLSDIVESHMVTDLAKPNVLKETNWIKPGRATWSWWSESDSPQDYNALVPYIDLASQNGWEYSLIDANWNEMKNGSLEKLATYANTKNVGLLVWYNSSGKHNMVSEAPRDLMYNREIRLKEFERISKLGIKGIKVDFFQSDKQEIINQYIGILEDAAKYNLVVNFHGCTLPRGWRKTYPNLLTMEALRGAESYKFNSNFPKKAPSHITTIPFLRGVVGPTDYTPLTLSDSKYPHLTTYGFELALSIIIESGIVHFSENHKILKNQPDFVIDFLKELPATWDDTKYLAGYPGKDVILARKKDNTWYIAGINGENTEKNFIVDLSILGMENSELSIIKDGHGKGF